MPCMQFSKVIIFVLLLFPLVSFSQGELDEKAKLLFRNENSYGFSLTSIGWELNYKFGKHINNKNKDLFEFRLAEIKSPKELKISNPFNPNGKRFVFGKLNSVYALRFGYGKQKKLFTKMDKGGIEIRHFRTIGLSMLLIKPVYYEVVDSFRIVNNYYYPILGTAKFNSGIHGPEDIVSRASFLKGFNELNVLPGAYANLGFGFEFSEQDRVLNSIEAGINFDLFPAKVMIMDNDLNTFFYFSIYAAYRFGNVKNARFREKKKKEKEDSQE